MKRQRMKKLAGLLAGLLLMTVPSAFAAGDIGATALAATRGTPNKAIVSAEKQDKVKFETTENRELESGQSVTYTVSMDEGYTLESISVNVVKAGVQTPPATPSIKLNKNKLSGTYGTYGNNKDTITATVDAWPTMANSCRITITAGDLLESKSVKLFAYAPNKTHKAEIAEVLDARVSGAGEYGNGKKAALSVIPHDRYELKSLQLSYALEGGTQTTTVSASTDWQGLKINWDADGQTTIVGPLYGDLSVTPTVERTQLTYRVRIYGGDGIVIERPSSDITTVKEGESVSVRIKCEDGYLIDQMMMQVGKTYTNWTPGQSYFMINYDRVQVRETDGAVSFVIPEITDDITIEFNTGYDQDNIPIKTEEGTNIHIDTDVGDTVGRGEDATFTIRSTSSRYPVKKITVRVGKDKGSANANAEYIRVGKRNYEIKNNGKGEYVLYIDNIREPVYVSAQTTGSDTVSRPTLTINSSSNMKITKSTSSSTINEGDSVRFYFTPYRNYQIDDITLKMGRESRTVSADRTSIEVGGVSYPMQRDANGVVTLYLDHVDQNVTVSGRAYYTRDPIQPTNTLRLDTSSRIAFLKGYTDGTFRPNVKMTRAEAVVMLHRLCSTTPNMGTDSGFYDVPSNMWCAREISDFVGAGIIDSGTYFYPNQYVTRGDFVEMLYRLQGSPSTSYNTQRFKDTSGTPNERAIYYAVSRGWVNGYADGTFKPYSHISRSEVAAVITRVLNRTTGGGMVTYKDVPAGHWAYRYIQLASSYV